MHPLSLHVLVLFSCVLIVIFYFITNRVRLLTQHYISDRMTRRHFVILNIAATTKDSSLTRNLTASGEQYSGIRWRRFICAVAARVTACPRHLVFCKSMAFAPNPPANWLPANGLLTIAPATTVAHSPHCHEFDLQTIGLTPTQSQANNHTPHPRPNHPPLLPAPCPVPRQECYHRHHVNYYRGGVGGYRICTECAEHARHLLCIHRLRALDQVALALAGLPYKIQWVQRLSPPTLGFPELRGWSTRLCGSCEQVHEQARSWNAAGMAFAKSGTVAERALWESVEVSCTCRRFLGDLPMPNNKYICKEHLEKNWNRLQAARDATNAWLTGLERRGGKMAVARAATVTMRTNNGEQRACPVSTIPIQEILMF